MFEKLFGKKKQDERHPMASPEGLARLIAGLATDDDATLLSLVDDWLDDARDRIDELGLAPALDAMLQLDAAAHEALQRLLAAYFSPGKAGHASNTLLERIGNHLARIGAAYTQAFAAVGAAQGNELRAKLLLAGERYFRAWGIHRRLGRFRQRPPGKASWEQAHRVLQQLIDWGLHEHPQAVFRGEPVSKPLREYLVAVYEETVPWGNLQPIQLELAARLIQAQEGLAWSETPDSTTTHRINIELAEGPRRTNELTDGGGIRYLSTANLHTAVKNLLAMLQANERVPKWLDGLTLDPAQTVGVLNTLGNYWSLEPPSRQSTRAERYLPMFGAFGFALARQLVEATQNVRKGLGQPAKTTGPDRTFHSEFDRAFAAHRFGKAEGADDKAATKKVEVVLDPPLSRLQNLEKEIGNLVLENWTAIDISDTGLGVAVPALLPRHAAGVLVAWRETDEVQWQIGVIRRVGRDGNGKPTAGIETVGQQPATAVIHLLRETHKSTDAWDDQAEWVFALLPAPDATQVIAPAGSFCPDMPMDLICDQGQRRAVMKSLVERQSDWERIEIEIAE